MLKISAEEKEDSLRLTLEGRLVGPWVAELRRVCGDYGAPAETIKLTVDLCGLTSVDTAGQELLQDLFDHGASLRCSDVMNQYLVELMSLTKKKSSGVCRPCQASEAAMSLSNERS
jgi:ABC-type transporter Mla MlaB component